MRLPSRDSGSVTVLLALWIVVLCIVAAASGAVLSVVDARVRVSAAADLGALAGAVEVLAGPTRACAAARSVVAANGAGLQSCQVQGVTVRVRVVRNAVPGWSRIRVPPVTARARAALMPGGP